MRNVLGLLFAFDESNELRGLTDERTVSAVPYGGRYRVIDFMLSSMVNSGIFEIGILLKDRYQSLMDHVGSGKDWDLARKRGGVFLLPPYSYEKQFEPGSSGPYRGKMGGLAGISRFIGKSRKKYVILSDGDIVANINLVRLVASHVVSGADITAVGVPACALSGGTGTFLKTEGSTAVKEVRIGGRPPAENGWVSAAGVYVMEREALEQWIHECVAAGKYSFERDILQERCGSIKLCQYGFSGYFAKMTDETAYFQSHRDLLQKKVRESLFDPMAPVYTKVRDEAPVLYADTASAENCLVADGCVIAGEIRDSVLFRGVRVGKGAVVENCILMQGCVIGEGARLTHVVMDKDAAAGPGRHLSGSYAYPVYIARGRGV